MAGWNRKQTMARVGGVIVILATTAMVGMVFALSAPAQTYMQPYSEPNLFPLAQENQTIPRTGDPPPLTFDDANIQPAQYTMPGSFAGGSASIARQVTDPPTPIVRIQVRVAADSPPGDDLKYIITVQNTSSADAHAVTVRNPLSDAILQPVNAQPDWDRTKSAPQDNNRRQLIWSFGTLAAGKSRTIELTLRPKPDATDVKNLAYVQFEHGEAVTTRLSKPSLKVSKTATKQAVRDEPYLVRVLIENTGKVIAENIRVTENVPEAAEFEAVTRGAKRTSQQTGQQWIWEIAKLMPGERKTIEFRVTARSEAEALTLTNVSAAKGVDERAETRTQVLVPNISLKLTSLQGTNGVINPGESAKYEITVRNTGTLSSTNVRVTSTIPTDCKPTLKTDGGQVVRDTIQWTIPRLEPSEAQTFRFGVKASTTGRRTVAASVTDARGLRASDEVATMFQGAAALSWESKLDPPALSIAQSGACTVKISNKGGEVARNVQLEVDIDRADSLVLGQVTPNASSTNGKLVFNAADIPARGEVSYNITYQARQAAQVVFTLKLNAECLGNRPMQVVKALEINGGVK